MKNEFNCITNTGVPKKGIHNLSHVMYVLLFEVELSYSSNV